MKPTERMKQAAREQQVRSNLDDSPKLDWQRSMRQMVKYAARLSASENARGQAAMARLIAEAYQADPIEVNNLIDKFYLERKDT